MEQRICKQCGKAYIYHGHGSGDHTKYCSDDCFAEVKRKANLRAYHKNHKDWKLTSTAKKRVHESEEKRRQWLSNSVPDGFEYLGDWTGGNTKISLKCLKHGIVVCRNIDTFRVNSTIKCERCRHEYDKARQKAKAVYGSREEYLSELARQKEERERAKRESRKRIVVCDVCGIKFITYNPRQKRCSSECSHSRRKDKRLTKVNTIDKNITLPRLYKRDGGFCYICGLKCNWEDKEIRDDGAVIYGSTYPTIDHVFPLAKGGKHSWENVKLAHWVCNIRKSDDITDAVADGDKVITSGRVLPKKTLQYDIKGNLIHAYSSTVEAAKVTGFKRKQIQNCARGETRTYRGYVWKYA